MLNQFEWAMPKNIEDSNGCFAVGSVCNFGGSFAKNVGIFILFV